eukprot:2626861-Amphidinium_carterae.1
MQQLSGTMETPSTVRYEPALIPKELTTTNGPHKQIKNPRSVHPKRGNKHCEQSLKPCPAHRKRVTAERR